MFSKFNKNINSDDFSSEISKIPNKLLKKITPPSYYGSGFGDMIVINNNGDGVEDGNDDPEDLDIESILNEFKLNGEDVNEDHHRHRHEEEVTTTTTTTSSSSSSSDPEFSVLRQFFLPKPFTYFNNQNIEPRKPLSDITTLVSQQQQEKPRLSNRNNRNKYNNGSIQSSFDKKNANEKVVSIYSD